MNDFQPSKELQENYYGKDLVAKSNWYGEVARSYDLVRPRYSDRLIDLAITRTKLPTAAKILEIGCGPGIATTSFAKRGFNLISLEPNLAASQLARENCAAYPNAEICQTTVEEWSVIPDEFDAILAATSLHWVAPDIGYPKIDRALKDGGSLILLWNAGLHPSEKIKQLLQPIYQTHAPTLQPFKPRAKERAELQAVGQTAISSGYFKHIFSEQTIVEVDYTVRDYLLLLSTYSPYIALPTEQRHKLFSAMEEMVRQNFGDCLSLSYLSVLQVIN